MIDELARRRERLQVGEPEPAAALIDGTANLYWLQVAERERGAAHAAWSRLQAALVLSGNATGGGAATRALEEARAIAEKLRAATAAAPAFDRITDHRRSALHTLRAERRLVAGDCVAIHADALIGLEAELAKAISDMHDAKARLAEYLASATGEPT